MWIRNTSSYPDAEVRALVELATADLDMARVCVNVKGGTRWGGHAYDGVPDISNAPPTARNLVTIKLPEKIEPIVHNAHHRARWPVYKTRCWRELLVVLAAHEGKHVEQYREDLRRSELRCEHFARLMLAPSPGLRAEGGVGALLHPPARAQATTGYRR